MVKWTPRARFSGRMGALTIVEGPRIEAESLRMEL